MALEIFKLVGSVFVDTDAAEKSIKKTDESAEGLGKTLLKGVGTAAKWGAGIATAAGAGATALFGFTSNAASAMDVIDKGSAKIGISKQAYQEWSYVLGQNGMDIDRLETGMKTLVTSMDSAASGSKAAQDRFAALGVSIYDSSGKLKNQEVILRETLYALANMENGTEKARLATELFGKAGVEMMPMLNGGAEGMEELTERAHELGLVISDEAVTAGVTLGDTLDDVKQSFGAIGTKIGASFMPAIQGVLDLILNNLPAVQGLFNQLAPVLTGLLSTVLPPIMSLAQSLLPIIFDLLNALLPIFGQIASAILPVFITLMETLLPPITEIVQTLLPPLLELLLPLLDLLQPILELLQPILDLVVGVLEPLAKLITELLTPLISVVSQLISSALVPLKSAFSAVSDVLSGALGSAFNKIIEYVGRVKNTFKGIITFIKDVFTGNWKGAWEGVKNIFSNIISGIAEIFKIPLNLIIDGINFFIRGLNKIKIPDWVPGIGGYGIHINEIPRLEEGAVLEKGQTGFLEGNGAEAVVPLEKNKKWISAVARDMDSAIGGSSGDRVVAVLMDILASLEDIARMGIYLDKEALVGGIAKAMDRKLGSIQAQKARA